MNNMTNINTRRCLVCSANHATLYWHFDKDTNNLWCYCNKCARGYSLHQYCSIAGISVKDFLQNDIDYKEEKSNEVTKMEWPSWFLPLHDRRSQKGADYVKSRGLSLEGDMFYDTDSEGIVFPYYYSDTFCGAQIRFIKPRFRSDGDEWKIDTMPQTRLGLLFYGYPQNGKLGSAKGIIVTEGAFNALSLRQSFNKAYGGVLNNPWKCIATSGCNLSSHHIEVLTEMKNDGYKIVLAYDADEGGLKGLRKAMSSGCLTHYSLTGDDAIDWNDLLKNDGPESLVKTFLGNIKNV